MINLFSIERSVLRFQPQRTLREAVKKCNKDSVCDVKIAFVESILNEYPVNHPQVSKIKEYIEYLKRKQKCTDCRYQTK